MTRKSINETELQNMRRNGDNNLEIADSSRYTHKYFVEVDLTNTFVEEYLVFTVKVNFLPRKPVYIDIINLRELISSMTRTLRNSETISFKNELLDLLNTYEKNS